MSAYSFKTVLSVRHWTDNLFSFHVTRDLAFPLESGQFTMIGFKVNGEPLNRVTSPSKKPFLKG
ncbi:hypothetical protein [Brucella intermedia]|uniref:hypothetical protein n=1 Tax=Brucella intermedia TaxID=94625 RepID=UPI000FBDA3A7|nr:hypothetical protein [Brucella intermedia]KAB2707150.1 hypothetical protein F9K80_18565 [Brucella intermedia]